MPLWLFFPVYPGWVKLLYNQDDDRIPLIGAVGGYPTPNVEPDSAAFDRLRPRARRGESFDPESFDPELTTEGLVAG